MNKVSLFTKKKKCIVTREVTDKQEIAFNVNPSTECYIEVYALNEEGYKGPPVKSEIVKLGKQYFDHFVLFRYIQVINYFSSSSYTKC